jgi:hypothetical protein
MRIAKPAKKITKKVVSPGIKKEHLKKDAMSFKEIGEETKEINKELKGLKARDKKAKK